jgi:hypothetical protein
MAIPAGIPSTTPPIAVPWLSPNEVNLYIFPNVFMEQVKYH